MEKWNWKAILGGLAVDILGGLIFGALIGIPFFIQSVARGNLKPAPTPTTSVLFIGMCAGLLLDMLGGYLTAMWAPDRKVGHAIIMGCLSAILTTLPILFDSTPFPFWFTASVYLVLPAALLGGWWRVRQHEPEPEIELKQDTTAAPIASPFGD
ncbi:hypothetical protein EON80_01505 [bacterium]|nr:MAG: hypothetical protein EON80_01505 [bacterium]